MTGQLGSLLAGLPLKHGGSVRTRIGGTFPSERSQRIDIPDLLPSHLRILQASTEMLRHLFPILDWPSWGVEIVSGSSRLFEIHDRDELLIIDRRALDHLELLSWEGFAVVFGYLLREEFAPWLSEKEQIQFSRYSQLLWFQRASAPWQIALLASLLEDEIQAFTLARLLLQLLPPARLEQIIEALPEHQAFFFSEEYGVFDLDKARWIVIQQWLSSEPSKDIPPLHPPDGSPHPPPFDTSPSSSLSLRPKRSSLRRTFYSAEEFEAFEATLQKVERMVSLRSLFPWDELCGPMAGILARYFYEIDSQANSTDRRLGLFRICIEAAVEYTPISLAPKLWPRLSLAVLHPERHPKIYQALIQFLELHPQLSSEALWSLKQDEGLLAQLAVRNQLGEQDDRFFRQATHMQAIWRDVLHRNTSQPWSVALLFQSLEVLIQTIQTDQQLFFLAAVWNQATLETTSGPIEPPLQNLRELLWTLSQVPAGVLKRLYPQDKEEAAAAHQAWPFLRTHIKKYLHLAPSTLTRLIEQIEEEIGTHKESPLQHIQIDADPEIPQQDLHGRIMPLLARPEMAQHRWVDLEHTETLRVVYLDPILHRSSGQIREQRFFSSFLLFFKTRQDRDEGGWSEIALWIDKDIDFTKVFGKQNSSSMIQKNLSLPIRWLLQEDSIWDRTYRYQFLTVDQLLTKLRPCAEEWGHLLRTLAQEYQGLLEQRIREWLDHQFYRMREQMLGHHALTGKLSEARLHPFFRLAVGDFEGLKAVWAKKIVASALHDFRTLQFQDDRSWSHAHAILTQTLRQLSQYLRLPIGTLVESSSEKTGYRAFTKEILDEWAANPEDFVPQAIDPQEWLRDKLSLLQRLESIQHTEAIHFVRFFLQQIHSELRVLRRVGDLSLDEVARPLYFKPIPSHHDPLRSKEWLMLLCDREGQTVSPNFLQLVCRIPRPLLQETLQAYPDLVLALQRAADLLGSLGQEDDHQTLLEIIQTLRSPGPSCENPPSQTSLSSLDPVQEPR